MAADIELRDEDRLPWLETVEPEEADGPGVGRVAAFVVLALLLLAAAVFAVYKLTSGAPQSTEVATENGQVIAPPAGDYKVKPQDPGGLKVGGEGDSAIATSTGTGAPGKIDTGQVPEKPVATSAGHAAPSAKPAATGAKVLTAVPASGGALTARPPIAAPHARIPGAGSGGAVVQLGAFPTEAKANEAWSGFARRFSYVATLGKTVQPATVGTRTVYRLRVNAGSTGAAADICGRLKVAGEDCFVTAG